VAELDAVSDVAVEHDVVGSTVAGFGVGVGPDVVAVLDGVAEPDAVAVAHDGVAEPDAVAAFGVAELASTVAPDHEVVAVACAAVVVAEPSADA